MVELNHVLDSLFWLNPETLICKYGKFKIIYMTSIVREKTNQCSSQKLGNFS